MQLSTRHYDMNRQTIKRQNNKDTSSVWPKRIFYRDTNVVECDIGCTCGGRIARLYLPSLDTRSAFNKHYSDAILNIKKGRSWRNRAKRSLNTDLGLTADSEA